MRYLIVLLVFTLSGCCALRPDEIAPAPEKQAPAVVFDIDGTLTPKVISASVARTDAAKAVRIFADKGYKIIYLSARVIWLQAGVPDWLKENGFPDGNIQLSQTNEDHSRPDEFKARVLKSFIDHGWSIQYAYGDSATDFKAYAAVEIPKDHIFALLRDGETQCEGDSTHWNACLNGWTEHLDFVAKSVRSLKP